MAAVLSVGLSGPLANLALIGEGGVGGKNSDFTYLSVSTLMSAVLVGIGGTRWIMSETQKTIFRNVASKAAEAQQNKALSEEIQRATPQQALGLSKRLSDENEEERHHRRYKENPS